MFTIQRTQVFIDWFVGLKDSSGKARILARITRAEGGNLGDIKAVGDGVNEMRLDTGPGYRLYFSRRGQTVYLLLCGGDKASQAKDIARARQMAQQLPPE
ncbi:MAG: type II toxin-antitoxin system RelE/ParE family toxin [Stagnimonas sp.]|nr:type II toxin-antitoxin system RelE/ParE family toxin [Stagnimonas sp.]